MTVELLGNASNDILDLTGGSDATDDKSVQEGEEQVLDTSLEGDTSTEGDNTTTSEEGGQDSTDDSTGTDGDTDSSDESVDAEYFFGDKQVEVEVPKEIASALDEAGIDKNELLAQLFKKDGDFSIDDDMRSKLEAKFGKTMVDGYLNMYKGMNEQAMQRFAADAEAQKAELEQQGKEYADAVGGEEGLVKMEDYIIKNFDDNQLAAYNAVMETGDHASQMLIISQTKQLMELADKLENGDKNVKLIGDKGQQNSGISSPMDKGYLTNAEYNQIMESDKYWTDKDYMARVDAARMAGFKHDA